MFFPSLTPRSTWFSQSLVSAGVRTQSIRIPLSHVMKSLLGTGMFRTFPDPGFLSKPQFTARYTGKVAQSPVSRLVQRV